MSHTCLNPNCDTDLAVIGVCVSCSNSAWKPKQTGVEVESGFVTDSETNFPTPPQGRIQHKNR